MDEWRPLLPLSFVCVCVPVCQGELTVFLYSFGRLEGFSLFVAWCECVTMNFVVAFLLVVPFSLLFLAFW